ncbi:MAG: trypsin-like peptidase domain-containing protein [Clostridia bacterium]|nr:trypsin-like peptidase domain-containing protein [Clostridia bacterium]
MAVYCKNCGGEAKELSANQYECLCCGERFSTAPARTEAPAPAPAPAPAVSEPVKSGRRVWSGDEIYEHAIGAVVEVYAMHPGSNWMSSASGFVISEKGFILTNAHAVLDDKGKLYEQVTVKTSVGNFAAKIVAYGRPADGRHDNVDLCLLFAEGLRVEPNVLGDSGALKNGQKVYLIGNSLGAGTCITSGIISDKARAQSGLSYPYIMTDAAANHGNSGGPLFNEYGEVIGVLVAGIENAKGMNFAIPSDVAKQFIEYVFSSTEMKYANLGDLNEYAVKRVQTYSVAGTLTAIATGISLVAEVINFLAKYVFNKNN